MLNYRVIPDVRGYKTGDGFDNPAVQNALMQLFVDKREDLAIIFNRKIDKINKDFELTGKPCSLVPDGEKAYAEDINPEYANFIIAALKYDVDNYNAKLAESKYPLRYYFDPYVDIRAYLADKPEVNVGIYLKPY